MRAQCTEGKITELKMINKVKNKHSYHSAKRNHLEFPSIQTSKQALKNDPLCSIKSRAMYTDCLLLYVTGYPRINHWE